MPNIAYQSPWMNDDLRVFRKTVRSFIQEELAPHQARWRQQHRPDAEAWRKAGAAGVLLTDVPEKYDGGGGTFAHEAVVTEELAQAESTSAAASRASSRTISSPTEAKSRSTGGCPAWRAANWWAPSP